MESRQANPLWALVLAGGDGTRLQALIRLIAGAPIPKQYCRIAGDRSLLEETLARVAGIVPRLRTLAVVDRSHLSLARPQLRELRTRNVIIQPRNRDTGLLLRIVGDRRSHESPLLGWQYARYPTFAVLCPNTDRRQRRAVKRPRSDTSARSMSVTTSGRRGRLGSLEPVRRVSPAVDAHRQVEEDLARASAAAPQAPHLRIRPIDTLAVEPR
jgi:hypothetical protein